jgi:hypothetical protein
VHQIPNQPEPVNKARQKPQTTVQPVTAANEPKASLSYDPEMNRPQSAYQEDFIRRNKATSIPESTEAHTIAK